ncbi:MAG: DUF1631 domain-containing protein [Gammaproteobacteria bacterium]|nr:DUF1631 domain-containing protein [Gammaproteobacteria bacterium]
MDVEKDGSAYGSRVSQGKNPPPLAASGILQECRARVLAFAAGLPGRFFEVLERDLTDQASNVFASPEQGRVVEGLRIAKKGKAELEAALPERFSRRFDRKPARDAAPSGTAGGASPALSLSLVDDSELEESLAVNTLIGKLRERYSDELFGLSQRYEELAPGTGDNLPMGPDAFCDAFRDGLGLLELEPPARVHCYKLFERVLIPGLGECYAELNKFLVAQGVLPQLKAKIRTQPAAPGSHQPPGVAAGRGPARRGGGAGGGGAGSGGGSATDEGFFGEMITPLDEPMVQEPMPVREPVFQAMQHLLGGYAGGGEGDLPATDARPSAIVYLPATPMLIDTLSSLQHDPVLVEHTGELLRGGLKQHVVGRFATVDAQGRSGMINQIDDETIDVISMIFDYIFDDTTLPDFVKALIGRLQIPVLKAAIVDREFFSDKAHPVRQLLNELAFSGVGWDAESDAVRDRLYEKMEAVVRRVLGEFNEDVALFAEVLGEFRAFLEEEKKSFALLQQQIGSRNEEAEQTEQIRHAVAEEIAGRVAGRDVPAEVREFLATTWRQLLTEATLEEGRDGAWRSRALRALDDLLWSLEPKRNAEQRRRLGVILPVLLQDLREGQLRVGCREEEIEEFVAVLERCHFASMKGGRTNASREVPSVGPEAAPAGAPPQDGTQGPAQSDEIDRMFREISSDIDNLDELDVEGLSGFDDLLEKNDPERQSRFDRMMAEMGFETEGDGGPQIEDVHTECVRKLEPGAWIELTNPDGGKLRAKLAWAGDAYSSFSFVNRQYKVVAERPLYVLAEEFRNGSARVIENVALFDRALDGVISGIMKFARPRTQARHA